MSKPNEIATPYYVMVRVGAAWIVCARWKQSEAENGPVQFTEVTGFTDADHGDTHKSHEAARAYWERLTAPGATPPY